MVLFIILLKFLSFYTSDSVGAYFGTTSDEYELAVNYLGLIITKKPISLQEI